MQKPLDILKKFFAYQKFRGKQEEIINAVLDNKNVFVLMPTGSGKSLCYQIPALIKDGVAVVISPLIALMQDQVIALKELGVKAEALNSNISYNMQEDIMYKVENNEIDLVYISPERLFKEGVVDFLLRCKISLFAIDEAHCISSWGHDFRAEYAKLSVLADIFPKIPRIALTATADSPTKRDIIEKLHLTQNSEKFELGFDRPNIKYKIVYKENALKQLESFLRDREEKGSGIIYCISRKKVDSTTLWLKAKGYNAYGYHAGMLKGDKDKNQARFLKEEDIIMVATIAFGMGIDKPNVRFVVHLDLPKTIENYYQETGRAGRDDLPSIAWMLYGMQDIITQQRFVMEGNQDARQKQVEMQKLNALIGFCETSKCRRQVLLNYFSDNIAECGNCDNCLEEVKTIDGSVIAQKLLSAIYRTGQIFGGKHIVDVLLGADTAKIKQCSHHLLKTYGIGKEFQRKDWNSFLRQLVAQNIVRVDMIGYGALKFTEHSNEVIKGNGKVDLIFREGKVKKTYIRKERKSSELLTLQNLEKELFNKLKAVRLEIAKEKKLPPYVILHDTSLIELAKYKPKNNQELLEISGFGAVKIERYGAKFLKEICG